MHIKIKKETDKWFTTIRTTFQISNNNLYLDGLTYYIHEYYFNPLKRTVSISLSKHGIQYILIASF